MIDEPHNLLGKLKELKGKTLIRQLIDVLVEREEFQFEAVSMIQFSLNSFVDHFDDNFSSILKLLQCKSPSYKLIELSYGVKRDCNPQQLSQLNILLDPLAQAYQLIEYLPPKYIYSHVESSSELHRTHLESGQSWYAKIPQMMFKMYCSLCILPKGLLFFTGGQDINEVQVIDTSRDFAVLTKSPLLYARYAHITTFYRSYLYAIGGYIEMKECERYSPIDDKWEEIPSLPMGAYSMSLVANVDYLYALGGCSYSYLNLIQQFDLIKQKWSILPFNLPESTWCIPHFKFNNQECYLVMSSKLYLWNFYEFSIKLVKTLQSDLNNYWGQSAYMNGCLYASFNGGAVQQLVIGELV